MFIVGNVLVPQFFKLSVPGAVIFTIFLTKRYIFPIANSRGVKSKREKRNSNAINRRAARFDFWKSGASTICVNEVQVVFISIDSTF
jgi:hypothetical protein